MAKSNRKTVIAFQSFWKLGLLVSLWLGPNFLLAQARNGEVLKDVSKESEKDSIPEVLAVDTIPIAFYYQDNPYQVQVYGDTMLDSGFHQYDILRKQPFEWLNLGNVGSAARPVFFDPLRPWGLDMGFHQYDGYFYSIDSLRFYKMGRALTDTYFSFRGQENAVFSAQFARQFDDGFQFSLNYRKINQFGQFLFQTAKISSLATGVQYVHPKKRYTAYLSLGVNTAQNKENGGLATDTLFFDAAFSSAETQPIRLIQAQTLHRNIEYRFLHSYKIGHLTGSFLELSHKMWRSKHHYKFYDNSESIDSSYYEGFLTDGRGIRQFMSTKEFGNEVDLAFRGHQNNQIVAWLPTMGLSVVHYEIDEEVTQDNSTHINVVSHWNVQKSIFDLSARAVLGLVGQSGDYLLNGKLGINTKKVGQWALMAEFQSVSPSLLAQKSYISQVPIWENSFKKEFVNRLGAQYELPSFDLAVGGYFSLMTNHVYYDQQAMVAQETKTIPLAQLFVRKAINFRGFHLLNNWLFQQSNEELIRRPKLYAHEQLYWEGMVLKKALHLKTGVDWRFFSEWKPAAYQPAIGQFYLQDDFLAPNMSGVDLFASFKVSSFRYFAKMENLNYYWDKRVFYLTKDYPQFKPNFRMGIAWRFRD